MPLDDEHLPAVMLRTGIDLTDALCETRPEDLYVARHYNANASKFVDGAVGLGADQHVTIVQSVLPVHCTDAADFLGTAHARLAAVALPRLVVAKAVAWPSAPSDGYYYCTVVLIVEEEHNGNALQEMRQAVYSEFAVYDRRCGNYTPHVTVAYISVPGNVLATHAAADALVARLNAAYKGREVPVREVWVADNGFTQYGTLPSTKTP